MHGHCAISALYEIRQNVFKERPMQVEELTNLQMEETPVWAMAEKIGREKALEETRAFIGHEIKSAIGPLKGFAELLNETLAQLDPNRDMLIKYAQKIIKQSDAAYEVVNRYLDYTRPLMPTPRRADINQMLLESLNEIRTECARHNIEISQQFGPTVEGHIDRELMAQALQNVLRNAIEAMEHGGKLTVATRQENDHVLITISDTGTGIKPEHLSRIFELGFTAKLGKHGAGVGLAFVRRVVEETHNGRVAIMNNSNGIGVTVTIALPMAKPERPNGD
jgi:signal transduction histidine kinase